MPGQYGENISVKTAKKFGDSNKAKGFIIDRLKSNYNNIYWRS